MSTQFEIFKHFGLQPQKRRDLVKSTTFERTREIILSAVYDSDWIGIAGPIGSGKTETCYAVLDELRDKSQYKVIDLFSLDRESVKISHVLNSIVYQLAKEYSDRESPRRDMEARTLQVLNILAAAEKKGKKVVLVVDEAQELHHMTIKALKRLHEARFMGRSGLITIILVGQKGLLGKVERDDEIRPRCTTHEFAYTQAELVKIARHHSFNMLSEEEARTVAANFGTPLEIRSGIHAAMRKAYNIGADTISLKHFDFPDEPQAQEAPKRKKISVDAGAADNVNRELKNVS